MWYVADNCLLVNTSFSRTGRPLFDWHIFGKLVLYPLCERVLWNVFQRTGK